MRIYNRHALKLCVSLLMASAVAAPSIAQDDAEEEKEGWDISSPMGESSEVSISTDEGTWMNLDVSPDGQTIVFDFLGDIYTMPIAGGNPTNIMSGMAWERQPRFSPDGSKIAFTSDRSGADNIWIANIDGSDAKQITRETFRLLNNPTWSPDGNYIVARKHFTTRRSMGTGELWAYHVGGGSGVAIYERPNPQHQKDIGEPMYAPDGSVLYFSMNTTSGGTFEYAQDSNTQIYEIRSVDLTTGEVTDVVSGPGGAVRPTPSPDGTKMAFVRRVRAQSRLFVKDLATGDMRMIYDDLDPDMQETWAVHGVYPNMDWTPDGQSIVFWSGGKIRRINANGGEATVIPFQIDETRTVIAAPRPTVEVAPAEFETKMARWGQISPDGNRMIFESLGRIYIKNLQSGRVERLTNDRSDQFEAFPAYSRDGQWIVYVTWDDNDLGSVRKIRARGGRSTVLTTVPGHFVEPQMSPDNNWVVFRKTTGGNMTSPLYSDAPGIYKVPANGGEMQKILEDGNAPHFGPGSDRVYMDRFAGDHELFSTDLDGDKERVHATSQHAIEMSMAPSGNYVAFREGWHVYLTALPKTGGAISVGPNGGGLPSKRLSAYGGQFINWSADGSMVRYSAGPTLFSVAVNEAFAKEMGASEEDFEMPTEGHSMAMTVAADVPSSKIALVGARLITMGAGAMHVIESGTIVVDGNRIVAVGAVDDVEVPSDATVMDVTGKTIIPGLIDAHAHGSHGNDGLIAEQNYDDYATLALGVTTVFDPSSWSPHIFTESEYQRAGEIIAPRIYSTGEIVYGARGEFFASIESYDDALAHVRRLKANGALGIKNYNQPRREQRQMVAAAAREENMLVVPEGGAEYSLDMTLIADGNSSIEHSLAQQRIYEDVKQFWSGTQVAWNMTLVVNYGGIGGEDYWYQHSDVWKHPILSRFVPPHVLQPRAIRRQMAPESDYAHFENAKQGKQLADRGVLVMTGAHGQREGLATHWEMWLYADDGASAMDALHAATVNPAKHLGMWDDLGSIEVGKLADMVILDANPLANIRDSDQISHVMINGRLYETGSMNEMLSGDRMTEPFYWWGRPEAEIR